MDGDLTYEEMKYLYFTDKSGERHLVLENALECLDERLEFFRTSPTIKTLNGEGEEVETQVIALALNANDLFYWACGDMEYFSFSDVETLFNMCFDGEGKWKKWGDTKWICMKRKMRPQHGFVKMIKKDGAWDSDFENLPEREVNFLNPDYKEE